jgi:hypothetical protein
LTDFATLEQCVNALPPVFCSRGPYKKPVIRRERHLGGGRYFKLPKDIVEVNRSDVDWHFAPAAHHGVQVGLDGDPLVYDSFERCLAVPLKGAGGPRTCRACGELWQPVRQKEPACSPECAGRVA